MLPERVYEIVVGKQPTVGVGLPRPPPIMNCNERTGVL